MASRDPRVDAYIAKAAPFAQPILEHLRNLVHKACPAVEETMKWSFPHFDHKGIVCSMAAFKQHCAFGFWKASLLPDPRDILETVGKTAMGSLGNISSLEDLPSDKILVAYIKEAVKLNEEGIKIAKKTTLQKTLSIPAYFKKALSGNPEAKKVFEGFNYTNRKDYVEWLEDAKTETTRSKRLQTTIDWLSEGKIRNWKYMKK